MQMTLGEAINWCDKNKSCNGLSVVFDGDGGAPSKISSYRGYYEDLAISVDRNAITLAEFEKMLTQARGRIHIGYKGGEYFADNSTLLWRSEYGMASDMAIIGMSKDGRNIVIHTEIVE